MVNDPVKQMLDAKKQATMSTTGFWFFCIGYIMAAIGFGWLWHWAFTIIILGIGFSVIGLSAAATPKK